MKTVKSALVFYEVFHEDFVDWKRNHRRTKCCKISISKSTWDIMSDTLGSPQLLTCIKWILTTGWEVGIGCWWRTDYSFRSIRTHKWCPHINRSVPPCGVIRSPLGRHFPNWYWHLINGVLGHLPLRNFAAIFLRIQSLTWVWKFH